MPAKSDPREDPADNYYYRRNLSLRDLLPAIGAGLAVGAAAFYVARILLQRAPVTPEGVQGRPRRARTLLLPARGG